MGENKLVSLDELIQAEKAIVEVANSGEILQTINLCEQLKGTAKENVKIAHSIRNQKYSGISQRIKYLQEQGQYLPEEDAGKISQEVELLSQSADMEFQNYLKYLQEDIPRFTRDLVERARLKYHSRRYP